MERYLSEIHPDCRAIVLQVGGNPVLKRRLLDLGLVPGTEVCCRYRSPGGGVTALEFRGTVVALRTKDLRRIRVDC